MNRGSLSKWFPMLIYEEQYEAVKISLDDIGYKYAMIKHDKDFDENGELKKVHWHVVVICEKREWQFSFARRIGIDVRFVQHPLASEPNGAIRYLTHIDNPEKAQYAREEIVTNISCVELEKLHLKAEKKSKDEENEDLLDDIECLARKTISYREFFRKHPSFIYQANSLLKLVLLAGDVQWDCTIDEKTGEIF